MYPSDHFFFKASILRAVWRPFGASRLEGTKLRLTFLCSPSLPWISRARVTCILCLMLSVPECNGKTLGAHANAMAHDVQTRKPQGRTLTLCAPQPAARAVRTAVTDGARLRHVLSLYPFGDKEGPEWILLLDTPVGWFCLPGPRVRQQRRALP